MFDEIDYRHGALHWPRRQPEPSRFWNWIKVFGAVSVVGIVIGISLSMLQTRGHANSPQLQCGNNLRQIGLGINQYASVYGQYPPGTIANPDLPLERRLGWGVTILPYLDNVEYFEDRGTTQAAAERLALDDPVFADLTEHPPGITHCPRSFTTVSFAAIAGLGADSPSLPTTHRRAGIFGDDRRVTPADVKDGTSTTMMLVESGSLSGPWFAGGRATVRGIDPTTRPHIGVGRSFGGLHPSGANVLFADGSVRFLSKSVDPQIFEALSTIAGGEAVPADLDEL